MIKFKLLHDSAVLPKRAKAGDAGFDLYSTTFADMGPGTKAKFPIGVACAIPEGWCGIIMPRSGLGLDYEVVILAGLIDSGYRGEINVCLKNTSARTLEIRPGDRIAQMVVTPFTGEAIQVDELDDTQRGSDGFNSTGRR